MLSRTAFAIWNEPPPPRPAGIPWWDFAVPLALVPVGVWEALHADTAPWRPVAVGLALVLPWAMVLRRRSPLLAFVAVSFTNLAVNWVALASDVVWQPLVSGGFVLALAYSLFRWGAGRQAAIGLLVLVVVFATTIITGEVKTVAEGIAAAVLLLFAPTLGTTFRFRAAGQRHALDQVRLLERERLARELHDTVAHHVSAIAIQAQAGRAVAAMRPASAVEALSVIEEAASQTLSELRTIVAALREEDDAELAPQRGIDNLEEFTVTGGKKLAVSVSKHGALDDVGPTLEAAVYRVVQESVTNASRHAVGASRVDVEVTGTPSEIRVAISDDGDLPSGEVGREGFGLVGMKERASLLGGTFHAGPGPERGWSVEVVLPRKGAAR